MNKLVLLTLLALFAAALLAVPTHALDTATSNSTAENPSARGRIGGGGPLRGALEGAKKRLDAFRQETPLSEQQRSQIRDIVKPHLPEIRAQMSAMRDAQSQLHKATTGEGDATVAADKIGAAARNGALLRARLAREIRPVLTPEQRQRLDSAIEEFHAGAGKAGAVR